MTETPPRIQAILDGTSGLAPSTEEAYRRLWAGQTPDTSCIHRGAHIAWAVCATCPMSKTKLRVFACERRGRCVIDGSVDGLARCSTCADRVPTGAGRTAVGNHQPKNDHPHGEGGAGGAGGPKYGA